jgi:CBS domain-containing protein
MKAQDVMVRNVLTVGPDTSVADAVAMLVVLFQWLIQTAV